MPTSLMPNLKSETRNWNWDSLNETFSWNLERRRWKGVLFVGTGIEMGRVSGREDNHRSALGNLRGGSYPPSPDESG